MDFAKAIGALERGEIVEAKSLNRYRKQKYTNTLEMWNEKVGEWTQINLGYLDYNADYEISTDPMKPAEAEKVEAINEALD